MSAYRRPTGRKRRYTKSASKLAILVAPSIAIVGLSMTVSGACKAGQTVTVTVGGETLGEDTTTSDGTWSVTAACPDVDGSDVEVVATATSTTHVSSVPQILPAPSGSWRQGVGLTGDPCSEWATEIGAVDLSQATEGYRPDVQENGLFFDGTDDVLTGEGQLLSSTAFTILCKFDADAIAGTIFDATNVTIRLTSGAVRVVLTAGNYVQYAIAAGAHTLAVRYDGAGADNSERARLWVDGEEVVGTYSGTIPATVATGTTNSIGYAVGTGAYSGHIQDLQTFPELMSAGQIVAGLGFL